MTRSSNVFLIAGSSFLVFVLLVAGILKGENKYPDPAALAAATPYKNTFFDPDPNHPWNQLYGMLFIRPAWDGKLYGLDEMDPLYWRTTRYLLEGPTHQKALAVLDKFIQSNSAHLIKTPLKRALLQHMLWALFDRWALPPSYDGSGHDYGPFDSERRELQIRLVKIMRSVALTDDEIKALPDNYNLEVEAKTYPADFDPNHIDQSFLPGTFYSRTDWVGVQKFLYEQIAPVHVEAVSGRSGFDVFISLPDGRDATLAYLKKLHEFQPHWVYDRDKSSYFADGGVSEPPYTNAEVPQVPLLTKFALVRKANLIDDKGRLVPSPITESVQIRVIRTILPNNSSGGEQTFIMFRLDQQDLMEGKGALKAEDANYSSFDLVVNREGGVDPLQARSKRYPDWNGRAPRLMSCFACHCRPGIFSMNSYIEFFQQHRTLQPPELAEGDSAYYSLNWKQDRYNWGLLQAYWFAQ